MDIIEIKNLEIFANHGVFPEENVLGQKFVVSAKLYTSTRKAGLTDELTASIHYGEVSQMITKFTKEHTYKLLETLAENLCQLLLHEFPLMNAITLRIEKPWAPVGLPLDTVAVEITRGWHTAYVAFGSNLGDKKKYIDDGIQGLRNTPDCEVEAISEYLVTEPYGGVEQDEFLNGVLRLRTILTPEELLDRLHELEAAANRERIIHWGPRTLDLDILFYDNEIITRAAKESGFAEETFARAEDKATNSLLYSLAMGINVYGNQDFGFSGLSLDDRIVLPQSDVIRKVAEEGPCIIVGRCADYVLKEREDVVNLFIKAAMSFRIERAVSEYDIEENKAADVILKNDKRRGNYYNYHVGEKWTDLNNYDLVVRSDLSGIDNAVKCICTYLGE